MREAPVLAPAPPAALRPGVPTTPMGAVDKRRLAMDCRVRGVSSDAVVASAREGVAGVNDGPVLAVAALRATRGDAEDPAALLPAKRSREDEAGSLVAARGIGAGRALLCGRAAVAMEVRGVVLEAPMPLLAAIPRPAAAGRAVGREAKRAVGLVPWAGAMRVSLGDLATEEGTANAVRGPSIRLLFSGDSRIRGGCDARSGEAAGGSLPPSCPISSSSLPSANASSNFFWLPLADLLLMRSEAYSRLSSPFSSQIFETSDVPETMRVPDDASARVLSLGMPRPSVLSFCGLAAGDCDCRSCVVAREVRLVGLWRLLPIPKR